MQPTQSLERLKHSPLTVALSGAVITSFSAIIFELSDADALTATVLRMVYALPVLFVGWLYLRHKDERTRRDRLMALVAGALLAADVVAWQSAIGYIGTGLATLIANSQVIIVPLTVWAVLGERPVRRVIYAMPVVVVGLALITGLGGEDAFGERPVWGVVLASGAAVLYSGFLILFRRSNRSLGPTVGPLMDVVAGAAVVATLIGVVSGNLDLDLPAESHAWLLALALGPQVVGWLLIGYAMPRLPSASSSFVILLQPTLTLIWGRILFDEIASAVQYAGVALVLAGIAYGTARWRQSSSEA